MRLVAVLIGLLLAASALAFFAVYAASEAKLRDVRRGPAFDYAIPTDAETIERGRHVARTRGCFGCHGQELEGKDFGEQWDWPRRAVAPNLAAYAKAHDAATIEAAIRQGISRDGRGLVSMPSYNFARLSDADVAAVIAFLRAAPVVEKPLPAPELGWAVRWEFARGAVAPLSDWVALVPPLRVDAATSPQRARGEYLAMTMCIECHGLDLRGQTLYPPAAPDLVAVAAYSRAEFEGLITTGVSRTGRELGLMALVAPDRFPELRPQEIDDLYAFLSSLADEPAPESAYWRPEE